MKKILSTIATICFVTTTFADTVPFGNGQLTITTIARNAVRIQYQEGEVKQELPEWIYVSFHGYATSALQRKSHLSILFSSG